MADDGGDIIVFGVFRSKRKLKHFGVFKKRPSVC